MEKRLHKKTFEFICCIRLVFNKIYPYILGETIKDVIIYKFPPSDEVPYGPHRSVMTRFHILVEHICESAEKGLIVGLLSGHVWQKYLGSIGFPS